MGAKIVLVTGTSLVPRSVCDYIESHGYAVRRVEQDTFTSAELHRALKDASGYLIGGYEEPLAEHFEQSGQLEAVAWIGTDYKANVPGWRSAVELGISMINAPGANATSVAEFTTLLLLTMARPFTGSIATADTPRPGLPAPGIDLRGRRLGIIGCGRIGASVARIAAFGFGMEVSYHSPRRNLIAEHSLGIAYRPRNDLLSSCDMITLHRPGPGEGEQPEIGRPECELLLDEAVLINTAHHRLLDPDALLRVMDTKCVRAAIDGAPDGEAWNRLMAYGPERFLVTPPMAFNTTDANLRASLQTAKAVCDVLTRSGRG
ncbi:NAD(P)-dependent oxidoreductase [Streptomyces sp. NPDC058783]|uniref:NAD(P)-dependent oxidoreductase n=1 Tax=unclassified Streptomyces TaxID=2593676 RepID=UPI0026E99941|nr:NAD(P)-dependent oxidoreductase [Streptomyces sp. HUAS CX7]WKX23634.1 NAD(P)-dependent oxidoreductase [Streptomyces sp. HUAS CX7]